MMKRLINNRASRIINSTVLEFYGININSKKDLAALDKTAVYAIKQTMTFVIQHRHVDAEEWVIELLVCCVLRHVMHLDPDISQEYIQHDPNLMIWGNVVTSLREYATQKYADCVNYEALYPIIVSEILMQLEKLMFRHSNIEIA